MAAMLATPFLARNPLVVANPTIAPRTPVVRLKIMAESDPVLDWIMSEGRATKILRSSPVGGGCISTATRYDTDAGSYFVKTNRDTGPSMFEAEAAGLNAMHATGTIRVPKPLKVRLGRSGWAFWLRFISMMNRVAGGTNWGAGRAR